MAEHIKVLDERPYENVQMLAGQTSVTIPFRFFSSDDIQVYSNGVLVSDTLYTVDGAGQEGAEVVRRVVFNTPAVGGENVVVIRSTVVQRENDYTTSGSWSAENVNDDFDKIVMMVQEANEVAQLTLHAERFDVSADLTLPTVAERAGKSIKFDANGNVVATLADPDTTVAAGAGYVDASAANAALALEYKNSAQNAATTTSANAVTAANAAVAANNSAIAAAAAVASIPSESTVSVISDRTILTTENGTVFSVDCSAGDVIMTLPLISAAGEPFYVSVKKSDASNNHVIVTPSGTDEIQSSATSYVISDQTSGAQFLADIDTNPDNWEVVPFGLAVGDTTPIGFETMWPGTVPPPGWLPELGGVFLRELYPDLWEFIQTSGNLVSEATWTSDVSQQGHFSSGDGTTTFRVPNKVGLVDRGQNPEDANFGRRQEDAIQNITGNFYYAQMGEASVGFVGAFAGGGVGTTGNSHDASAPAYNVTFDASRVVRTDTETRMKNSGRMPIIKAFNTVINQAMMDVDTVLNVVDALVEQVGSINDGEPDFLAVSAPLAYSTSYVFAHPLGAKPSRTSFEFQFAAAVAGYSIGERVDTSPGLLWRGVSEFAGFTCQPDASNINILTGNATFVVLHKTTKVPTAVTAPQLQLVVRAWLGTTLTAGVSLIQDGVTGDDSVWSSTKTSSELALKADAADLSGLASTSYVDAELADKADISYVDTELADKADTVTVSSLLANKVDSSALAELTQDVVGAMLEEGTNITLAYNDGTGKLVINAVSGDTIGAEINDAVTATDTTWSSTKIASEFSDRDDAIDLKADITYVDSGLDDLLDVPQVLKSTAYVLALTDRGKSIDTIAGVTVPPNSSVAFPIGTVIGVCNTSSSSITITQGSGVTLRHAGTVDTGNRSLSGYGQATMRKVATDTWYISGAGLT
jgi:hypothetical protein